MLKKAQFLIAAPASNSGKTTLTLGLLKALSNRGYRVQPYKCGPDYIDPILHEKACGLPSINLDSIMASTAHVQELYSKHLDGSDIGIVEGVMGLFDGADKMKGSSAEIALLLDLPVILVINAKAMAYSAAALIYGFKHFRPDLKLVGVIFNNVNTPSHYCFLQDACLDTGVEALGYLPTQPDAHIPSRHLGLSIDPAIDFGGVCDLIASSLEQTVSIDRLLELTGSVVPVVRPVLVGVPVAPVRKIAIARDEAFRFIYAENVEILKSFGEVSYFSPLTDSILPICDLLYLPGGYPELFLSELSENTAMLESVRNYCLGGGKAYAECGGMMYLGQSIADIEGIEYRMAGFIPIKTSMQHPKLHLGYRTIYLGNLTIRGHEFHYSTCEELEGVSTLDARIENARGLALPAAIYRREQTIASYNHLYWGDHPSFIELLLNGGFNTPNL